MASALRWVCLLCWSGAEWQVFTALCSRGVRAVYPRVVKTARRGRWPQGSYYPLFPGYVFAGLDGVSADSLRRTLGVRELLRTGQDLVVINGRDMAALAKQSHEVFVRSFPHRVVYDDPRPGLWVKVPEGSPFAGMPARIETIDRNGQITASLGALSLRFQASALPRSVRGRPQLSANGSLHHHISP